MKRNELIMLVACAVAFPCALSAYGEEAAPGSGKLDDVVVKGKDTLKINREKNPLDIKLDPMQVIAPTLETSKYLLDKLSKELAAPKPINVPTLSSDAPVSPWLHAIARSPIASFQLNANKAKSKSWEFVVTDTRGVPFWNRTGNNEIPSVIDWDGRDSSGGFIHVGNTYSYILYFNDKAGNRRTIIGKPFIVNAALHQETPGLFISFTSSVLFDTKKDAVLLLPAGEPLLDEASDVLKDYFRMKIILKVYAETESQALDQGKAVSAYLQKKMILPEESLQIEAHREVPEDYHVDLFIPNR